MTKKHEKNAKTEKKKSANNTINVSTAKKTIKLAYDERAYNFEKTVI